MSKNFIPISIIAAGLIIGGAFIYVNQSKGSIQEELSAQEIAEKAINYLNENVLAEENTASLIDVTEEGDVYKIHLKIGEREYDSYVTPDGRFLFPEGYDLEAETKTETEEKSPAGQLETSEEEELSSEELEVLAKCLSEKGVKFYGNYGCSYCKKQKEIFGDAAKYLPYIECADEKTRYLCEEAEIGPVPTWDFPDGKRVLGLQSLEKLAELSGCSF